MRLLMVLLLVSTTCLCSSQALRLAAFGDYGWAGPDEQAVADMVKGWGVDDILALGDNNYVSGDMRRACSWAVAGHREVPSCHARSGTAQHAVWVRSWRQRETHGPCHRVGYLTSMAGGHTCTWLLNTH